MAFEMLIALNLSSEELYAKYREGMTPLLEAVGGGFRYDFTVSKVLKSEGAKEINRVFTIHFPDKATRDKFFVNPKYLAVREQFFNPAVADRINIAEYER